MHVATATLSLTNSDLAAVLANRTGQSLATVEAPITMSFTQRIESLEGHTLDRSRGVRPLMMVNTVKGKRGVYWVERKDGKLKVGTVRVTQDGFCHRPNKFDGRFFQPVESLAALNS